MKTPFRRKSKQAVGERTYGHDKTIHQTGYVDVETDKSGVVVAVWFRCQPLPFQQTQVSTTRKLEMEQMYLRGIEEDLVAVTLQETSK